MNEEYLNERIVKIVSAQRRAIRAADFHPHSDRRCAPAIMRLQRSVGPASKLAASPAADPQPVSCKERMMKGRGY